MELIETGVMVMKDGKAWGITYRDGRSTSYGWINPADKEAEISKPRDGQQATDFTYAGSPYIKELQDAEIVHVTRVTTVTVNT